MPLGAPGMVPSEVWMFLAAGGNPDGGAFFFDLKRKDIVMQVSSEDRGRAEVQ